MTYVNRMITLLLLVLGLVTAAPAYGIHQGVDSGDGEREANDSEPHFITNRVQLTFDGKRSGEGYFNHDGSEMVFQSERQADNPFYQIYTLNFASGETKRVSPGHGKTTCAWIHPDGQRVLFSSTQNDAQAKQKQLDELAFRESGQTRRYSWDYDENYELTVFDRSTNQYTQLTDDTGYDAEASYSPDGKWIAFASNRLAYSQPLSETDEKKFKTDPSYLMDIYVMKADGSEVNRLTDVPGYDGGPFFSPDGKRICWRRFSPDGLIAEIHTMNVDGSDQQQITKMNVMSWAPFYHPSGRYLIFTTNKHGFGNFELYLVDAQGQSPPVRVTNTEGFDGLASFTPDGKALTWTSNRNAKKQSQIYIGDWNHRRALEALGIDDDQGESAQPQHDVASTTGKQKGSNEQSAQRDARLNARRSAQAASSSFEDIDIIRHVDYLCRKELGGRMTGSLGEKKATAYVAAYMDYLGLVPAGDDGTFFQEFSFPNGAELGANNRLTFAIEATEVNEADERTKPFQTVDSSDFTPLTFSATGNVAPAPVVFAGYGIVAPKTDDHEEYDSYVHLDVKDKWVMVFRFVPEDLSPEQRQHFKFYSGLRKKAFHARKNGAIGLIVVSGPTSQVKNQLVPLRNDFAPTGSSIAAVSVTDSVAAQWLNQNGKDLAEWQKKLDSGKPQIGFDLKNLKIGAEVDVKKITGTGRNVVGRLTFSDKPSTEVVVVGAHVDHLGTGRTATSLAKESEQQQVHVGADDNASGVAAMLEIAEFVASIKEERQTNFQRDIIFAAWSGEELGLHGSKHFVETQITGGNTNVVAALNMDMVGRMKEKLVLQGIGSSDWWSKAIETKNVLVRLPVSLSDDTDLPTDATSFYQAGVPILSAFTGSHTDYHTPRDTPEKLNYPAAAKISKLMGLITLKLATDPQAPRYVKQAAKSKQNVRGGVRAYLGTVPSYGDDVVGVKLSDVTMGAPAQVAGVKGGDIIVGLAGEKIENIYDYTAAIDGLKINQETTIVVMRDGKRVKLKIVPKSRQ